MTLNEAIALLNQLLALPNAEGVKAKIIQIAQAAGLPAEGFPPGDPSERWIEIAAQAMVDWGWTPQMAVRGVFFPFATDPGDVDDFGVPDPSTDQTPRAGFLSALGVQSYGTERRNQTPATSFVTIRNAGTSATTPFTAGALHFEASGESRDDGGTPTYVSVADPSIYTGIGGTLVLAAGASVTIPVIAVRLGIYGSTAGAGGIDTCNTQSYGTLTVTASTKATGSEREERLAYIERCQLEGDGLAPGGPARAYRRAMNTARDGKPLQRFDGTGPVTITAAYVSADSATGEVTIYYQGPAGAVDDIDVSTANLNIVGLIKGVITDPMGVLPDCIGLLPLADDPNITPHPTPGGATCTNDVIPINYAVKLPRARLVGATPGTYGTPWVASTLYAFGQNVQHGTRLYTCTTGGVSGLTGPTGTGIGIVDGFAVWSSGAVAPANTTSTLGILDAIAAALGAYLIGLGIGGVDQVAGSGKVYTADLPPTVRSAQAGLYDPIVNIPVASSTVVALGHIATAAKSGALGAITGTLAIV